MAASYSFDIVSEFDRQELVNAVDQTVREIHSATTERYQNNRGIGRRIHYYQYGQRIYS